MFVDGRCVNTGSESTFFVSVSLCVWKQKVGVFIRWQTMEAKPSSSLSIYLLITGSTPSASSSTLPLWVAALPTQLFSPCGIEENYSYDGSSTSHRKVSTFPRILMFWQKEHLRCRCRGSCMWAPEVNWSSWMWKTVPTMETPVRTVS